jgi:hypothetical protein
MIGAKPGESAPTRLAVSFVFDRRLTFYIGGWVGVVELQAFAVFLAGSGETAENRGACAQRLNQPAATRLTRTKKPAASTLPSKM